MTLCPTGIWTGWSNLQGIRKFCSFFAKKEAEIPNHDIKRHLLGVEQVPFGVLGGRGRTCPARLWMVYGWLWEGRGPGMPGPYRAAIFAAGGALNVPRRGQDPSLQYLWKSRCLLVYWAVGAGHARPGCGWCTGGYGKAAGRACPAPYRAAIFAAGGCGGYGRSWEGPSKPLRPFTAAAHLHHSAGASVASGCAVSSGCGAFASRYA